MIRTTDQLRSAGAVRAVSSAAILHLDPDRTPDPPIDEWREARRALPTDEMAALLAMITVDPAGRQRFETFRAEVSRGPGWAASSARRSTSRPSGRIRPREWDECMRRRASSRRRPADLLLLAALLTHGPALGGLSPAELVEWVHVGSNAARRVQLAASEAEFEALGVALVEGLPSDAFSRPALSPTSTSSFGDAVTLLALHAWAYRAVLDATEPDDLPSP